MTDQDADALGTGSQTKGLFARAASKIQDAASQASASRQANLEVQAERQAQLIAEGRLYEYSVEVLRESIVGDKISAQPLQRVLDRRAENGWRLKSCTETSVKGRMGPGGVSGLVLIFERQVRELDQSGLVSDTHEGEPPVQ